MSQQTLKIDDEFFEKLSEKKNPLQVEYLSSGVFLKDLPKLDVPEIAFVGRSNVGKSSFLNFLSGQKNLARVSHTPGRTQMINLFSVEQKRLVFADLPGYGYAKSPREVQKKWQSAMAEYFEKRGNLCGVFLLMDIRRDIQEEDKQLTAYLQSLDLQVCVIQTKKDKIHKRDWAARAQAQAQDLGVDPKQVVSISSMKKLGLQETYKSLEEMILDL